jgi:hypothetical protein
MRGSGQGFTWITGNTLMLILLDGGRWVGSYLDVGAEMIATTENTTCLYIICAAFLIGLHRNMVRTGQSHQQAGFLVKGRRRWDPSTGWITNYCITFDNLMAANKYIPVEFGSDDHAVRLVRITYLICRVSTKPLLACTLDGKCIFHSE